MQKIGYQEKSILRTTNDKTLKYLIKIILRHWPNTHIIPSPTENIIVDGKFILKSLQIYKTLIETIKFYHC